MDRKIVMKKAQEELEQFIDTMEYEMSEREKKIFKLGYYQGMIEGYHYKEDELKV